MERHFQTCVGLRARDANLCQMAATTVDPSRNRAPYLPGPRPLPLSAVNLGDLSRPYGGKWGRDEPIPSSYRRASARRSPRRVSRPCKSNKRINSCNRRSLSQKASPPRGGSGSVPWQLPLAASSSYLQVLARRRAETRSRGRARAAGLGTAI